ncbi:type III secretion system chaperone [Succinimonas amylolytica]|uniref:type III secretion system chaperone n=1 Tax=Succinimonas amylolytica TaxID=83769 RepID=UPI0003709304|nr:type III secretion system chaperone [Succinimonas amylolytica]
MNGEELIKNLGQKLGLDLEPDETRSCNFSADDMTITVTFMEEMDILVLVGDLGTPPDFDRERLYKLMLEANYLYSATQGASLALNEADGHVCLNRFFPVQLLDDNSFYSHVERFINIGTFWMQVIRDLALAPEPEAKNETGSGDMEIFSEFMTV